MTGGGHGAVASVGGGPWPRWVLGSLVRVGAAALAVVVLAGGGRAGATEVLRWGAFAYLGVEQTRAEYEPLVAYLNSVLVHERVELHVLSQADIERRIAERTLDIVTTNPTHFLVVRKQQPLTGVIATLVRSFDGQPLHRLGGVVIVRADRPELQTLEDLRGKVVAAPSVRHMGGYRLQAYELFGAGVELPDDAARVIETETHQDSVRAVLDGRADVAFARDGVLERMVARGELDLGRIRVLNEQYGTGHPFRLSTHLYPEWPVFALPHVSERAVRHFASALFALEPDDPAAKAAGIHGYTAPADYLVVEDLARELRLPPFDQSPAFTLSDIWERHGGFVAALAVALGVIVALLVAVVLRSRRLRRQHDTLDALIRSWPEPMLLLEGDVVVEANPAAMALLAQPERAALVGRSLLALSASHQPGGEPSALALPRLLDAAWRGEVHSFEWQLAAASGDARIVDTLLAPFARERRRLLLCSWHDITARKRSAAALELAASVFRNAREGIVITDAAGRIVDVNETFTRITGYERDEVLGRTPAVLKSGLHEPPFYEALWRSLLERGSWSGEVWNRTKAGAIFAEQLTIGAVRDAAGVVQQYVGLLSDITVQKEQEAALRRLAHYDALTGLPNRILLSDRLQHAMRAARRTGRGLAVAYIDLDGFKAINDQHGHESGDRLLRGVAERMRLAVRASDTVARLGGDEFVALLTHADEPAELFGAVERLLAAATEAVPSASGPVRVSASIGLAFYPQIEEVAPEQLLRQADHAMLAAKQAGKNRFVAYDAEQDRSLRGRREGLARIRGGLEAGEFELHYQPKVRLRTGAVEGVEALLRWQHPERGLLAPAEFLPLLERHSLDIAVGRWAIAAALAQAARWQRDGLALPVSVNVSPHHLLDAHFVEELRAAVAAHADLPPGRLELEVPETAALGDLERAAAVMRACGDVGVGIALDGFGTGHSSLTSLKRLPARVLKIDPAFVAAVLHDPDDVAIIDAFVGLAAAFHRQVVAEGVESVEHGEALVQLGCECGQGSAIAPAMPADAVAAWCAAWRPPRRWADTAPLGRPAIRVLQATAEHRAWLRGVEDHLDGAVEGHPPLDAERCRVGHWLAAWSSDARERGLEAGLEEVHARHEALHELARRVVGAAGAGDAGLRELHGARDRLLEALGRLVPGGEPEGGDAARALGAPRAPFSG